MDPKQGRKITRNREFRACTECRRRKLKCDRKLPCTSCTRRDEAVSCVYESNLDGPYGRHGRRQQTHARLQHLEQLVQELSQSQAATTANVTTSEVMIAHRFDGSNGILHNGATHWSAMLEDIEDLRANLDDEEDIEGPNLYSGADEDEGMSLLFGTTARLSFEQVLATFLPSKLEADRAVAAYFRAKAVAAPFIHAAQFRRLYQLFWDNPSTAPPLWTSILFSILDIATRTLSANSGTASDDAARSDRFAVAAAHCLVTGGYNRPQRDVVEALLLYAQSRCLVDVNISPDMAILFGTVTRLATIMGYHIDPDYSTRRVSAFDGELRRRTWSLCMQLDMLVAFQMGLPSNIQYPTWNTKPPTNLLDSDFDEHTVQLPPARPDTESTELLFYIAKHKLMAVFERIIRYTLSTTEQPNEDLRLLDQELRATYAALPDVLRPRTMADSIVDPPSLVVTRLCVSFIFQKCLCVLHRKHVMQGRQGSIQTCYDSASNLVRQILDIHGEFEMGGQLESERWFLGSITWQDFLLGCTALCLIVCSTRHQTASLFAINIVDTVESLKMLEDAAAVCAKQSGRSKDTRKVQRLMQATIDKFSDLNNLGREIATVTPDSLFMNQPGIYDADGFARQSAQPVEPWPSNNWPSSLVDSDGWTYMEQFLDLSGGHFT